MFKSNGARTTLRTAAIMLLGTLMLVAAKGPMPDEVLAPLLTATGMIMYVAAFTHIIRKVLFPYIDLRALLQVVMETKNGTVAAIVIAAVVYIIGVLYTAFVSMLR
jgi:hypothetical protein